MNETPYPWEEPAFTLSCLKSLADVLPSAATNVTVRRNCTRRFKSIGVGRFRIGWWEWSVEKALGLRRLDGGIPTQTQRET